MSDGNYNRNLLPYNNYRSGFNAGRAQMQGKAIEAFRNWLVDSELKYNKEEIKEHVARFAALLSQ